MNAPAEGTHAWASSVAALESAMKVVTQEGRSTASLGHERGLPKERSSRGNCAVIHDRAEVGGASRSLELDRPYDGQTVVVTHHVPHAALPGATPPN